MLFFLFFTINFLSICLFRPLHSTELLILLHDSLGVVHLLSAPTDSREPTGSPRRKPRRPSSPLRPPSNWPSDSSCQPTREPLPCPHSLSRAARLPTHVPCHPQIVTRRLCIGPSTEAATTWTPPPGERPTHHCKGFCPQSMRMGWESRGKLTCLRQER